MPDSAMYASHLRNELDFWNVHGIMNTLGLAKGLHSNFARDPKCW